MTPPRQTPANATQATPAETIASRLGVSDKELEALRAELRAEQESGGRVVPDHAGPRKLTPRERAIRSLLEERYHAISCPVFLDDSGTAGRVEAYAMTAPAQPGKGYPVPRPVTVVRCMDCGGDRILEGDPTRVLLEALGTAPAAAAASLEQTLT